MSVLHFTVLGTPAPQGSKRHVGNGRMIEMSKRVGPWRDAVSAAALEAMRAHPSLCTVLDAPVYVSARFFFARPKKHYRTGRYAAELRDDAPGYCTALPDLDKTIRSTLDAMSGTVFKDDRQVVRVFAVKQWANSHAGEVPGATVTVREAL